MSKQGQLVELIKTTLTQTLRSALKTVEVKRAPSTPVYQQQTLYNTQSSISFPYPVEQSNNQDSVIQESFEQYQVTEPQPIWQMPEQQPEEPVKESDHGPSFFDHLHVLAQLHDSYILCSNPEGLVIIDQHAAQERYHYEQLLDTLKEPVTQQQALMLPIQIHVSSDLMGQIKTINDKVSFFGLHFEEFGTDRFLLREVPLWFQNVDADAFLQDMMDYFRQHQDVDMAALRKKMLATMACHSSIRFNRPLTMQEMKQVIEDLKKCRQPYHCPHGRPTVITLSDNDLRKEFERG